MPTDPDPLAGLVPGASRRGRRTDVQQLFDTLQQKDVELAKVITNSLGMKLVLIPAGNFLMGASPAEWGARMNEEPVHEVAITRPFYLAVHPVTQEQYEALMEANPSRFRKYHGGGPTHPVERISWDEANEFCRRLSARDEERRAGRVYRLPTEAEWEYACRAGTKSPFSFGDSLSAMQANFAGEYPYGNAPAMAGAGQTTPVGQYPANNFGLFDLHGNVWEWCSDWYRSNFYKISPQRDPTGPIVGQMRVLRGGSWRNHATTCRSAYRNALAPHLRDAYTGMRVAMTIGPQ